MSVPGASDTPIERAAALAALGRGPAVGPEESERILGAATSDADPRVRAAALAALVRVGSLEPALRAWPEAIADAAPEVRRRAAELGPALVTRSLEAPDVTPSDAVGRALVSALADADVTVVEAAAWALGEVGAAAGDVGAVRALAAVTTGHADAIAREAAVAALGAIGDPAGLPAILHATTDKATVRRRAVLALAPFEGAAVDAALQAALDDRDWQVRQAAEDLTSGSEASSDGYYRSP